ncbi:MAG: hypothetical protein HQ546_00160 [Planctomycetes bacterium]|nr:hypothetical protein [Planctomycetota bacterium]
MAESSDVALKNAIKALVSERAGCVARIAQIDKTFADLGVKPGKSRRGPGRPKGSSKKVAAGRKAGRRKRRKFAVSGDVSVLAFVKARKSPTTAEVNAHWAKEGRSGKADNALSNLVKAGKLIRVGDKKVRGSRYKIK